MRIIFFILLLSLLFPAFVSAQNFKNAGDYMSYIGKEHRATMEGYMAYTSAIAHSRSAKKLEAKRKELTTAINGAIHRIAAMPAYEGDATYRDSSLAFFKLESKILNEDYAQILNMEEVAEQSYDKMEAYWLAQDLANEKLKNANERLNGVQKKFAANNQIKLIDTKDDLDEKMRLANEVMTHYRKHYLIFFKALKQEAYILEALGKKDLGASEQNINSLKAVTAEGLQKLSTLTPYKNDNSLRTSVQQYLNFLKTAAEKDYPISLDYLLKKETADKAEVNFNKIPEKKRTQADVDTFNKTIEDFNKSVNIYNNTNTTLNTNRNRYINEWNKMVQIFLDKHVPRYTK